MVGMPSGVYVYTYSVALWDCECMKVCMLFISRLGKAIKGRGAQ